MNRIKNLILELNSRCNNNCVYCYIPESDRNYENAGLTAQFFKKVILEFRSMGVKNVDFTGGEPTLYKDLFELVTFSKDAGFDNRTLVTNGRMLAYYAYCRKVINSGINRVVLPLNGSTKNIAEAVSRTPGSYAQTISAIKNTKKLGVELGITTVVNALNYMDIPAIMGRSFGLGADFINIQFLLPYVIDKIVPCRKLPSGIIPKYSESVRQVKTGLDRFGSMIKVNVHFIPFCLMRGYEKYLHNDAFKFNRVAVNYRKYRYNIGEHLRMGSVRTSRCSGCPDAAECLGFFQSYSRELGIEDIMKECAGSAGDNMA